MPINEQVLAFARRNLRRRVGRRGECYDLANAALADAGARTAPDYSGGSVRPDENYVWGTAVEFGHLQPGDIIQFRDYSFTVTTANGWETQSRPHHTAIVDTVDTATGEVWVYEQNVGRGRSARTVQRNRIYFRSGSQSDGSTISVSGTWWFFRPQAR